MHDCNGKPLHCKDKVRIVKTGETFHICGHSNQDHTGAKHVAFANDVELVKCFPGNENLPPLGGGSIVWGNGPKMD